MPACSFGIVRVRVRGRAYSCVCVCVLTCPCTCVCAASVNVTADTCFNKLNVSLPNENCSNYYSPEMTVVVEEPKGARSFRVRSLGLKYESKAVGCSSQKPILLIINVQKVL